MRAPAMVITRHRNPCTKTTISMHDHIVCSKKSRREEPQIIAATKTEKHEITIGRGLMNNMYDHDHIIFNKNALREEQACCTSYHSPTRMKAMQ